MPRQKTYWSKLAPTSVRMENHLVSRKSFGRTENPPMASPSNPRTPTPQETARKGPTPPWFINQDQPTSHDFAIPVMNPVMDLGDIHDW